MLARDIIEAALTLYHASNDAVKFNVSGAVDRAIENEIGKSPTPKASLDAVLAGLRYAIEVADVIEESFKSPIAAE